MSLRDSNSMPLVDNGSESHRDVTQKKNSDKAKKTIVVLLGTLVVFLLGGIVGLYFQPPGLQLFFKKTGLTPGAGTAKPVAKSTIEKQPLQAPSEARHADALIALGRLMPHDDIITVALPFGANDARIAQLMAKEGTRFNAGDLIAVLDNADQLKADLEQARSQVEVKKAELKQVVADVESRRQQAVADVQKAKVSLALAEQDLARGDQLKVKGIITAADLDKLRASVERAKAELLKTTAIYSRYRNQDGAAQPDILLATQNLELSKYELKSAELSLLKSKVVSPTGGTVLKIHAKVGEKPSSNGVATLGNTDQMQAELEIFQSDIHRIELLQKVTLSSPALGARRLAGRISRVGLEVKRQQLVKNDPAANTDARVIHVRVALDEASSKIASALTGLQVTARINTDDK